MAELDQDFKSTFEVFDGNGISYYDESSVEYFVSPDLNDMFKAMKKIGMCYFALKSDKKT